MIETTYPMLDLFWTMLEFAVFVFWIWLIIAIVGDILWSSDLGGMGKALWMVLVVALPWVGILIYLVTRGGTMSQRWFGGNRPTTGNVYAPPTALSNVSKVTGGGHSPLSM